MGAKLGLDAPLPVIEAIVTGEDCSSKLKSFNLLDADNAVNLGPQSEISRKRDRRPNSLMNSEEGYEHFCALRNRKCRLNKPYERPKREGSQERKRRRFSRKTQNTVGPAVVSPETASDEEGELLVGCRERQPSQPPNREGAGSLPGTDSKRKKRSVASDKKKLEVSGKKVRLDGFTYVSPNAVNFSFPIIDFLLLHIMRRRWENLLLSYQSKMKLALKGPLELASKESRPQERRRYADWNYNSATIVSGLEGTEFYRYVRSLISKILGRK